MAIFYVYQKQTYQYERSGGYLWAPQRNLGGSKSAGYTNMTDICKDDFILHNDNGKLVAISIAKEDCYESDQPEELINADKDIEWNREGYRVDCEYVDFDVPVEMNTMADWLEEHHIEKSAFTYKGRAKRQYMWHLADEHARYILEQAIKLQKDPYTLEILREALSTLNVQ